MIAFTFTEEGHEYRLTDGRLVPSITQLLRAAGYSNDEWFTEEGRDRGSAVHQLAENYDRGRMTAGEVATCRADYRGYLASYVKASSVILPEWSEVEMMAMAEDGRFAGRLDRVGHVYRLLSVSDLKTGAPSKADPIQLALQAILVALQLSMPAEHIARFNWYLLANGKMARVIERRDPHDFTEARRILAEHGGAR